MRNCLTVPVQSKHCPQSSDVCLSHVNFPAAFKHHDWYLQLSILWLTVLFAIPLSGVTDCRDVSKEMGCSPCKVCLLLFPPWQISTPAQLGLATYNKIPFLQWNRKKGRRMFGGVNTEETFTKDNCKHTYCLNLILELNILITHNYWDFQGDLQKPRSNSPFIFLES